MVKLEWGPLKGLGRSPVVVVGTVAEREREKEQQQVLYRLLAQYHR
jgi:hypothetical protein